MSKIFLSYSHFDEDQAIRLYSELKKFGLSVWFDKETLLPGQDWETEIKKSIKDSDFVLLLLSSNSIGAKGFFQKELRLALDVLQTVPFGHIYILPARLDDCEIPAQLAPIHYVDLFPNWIQGITKLQKAIEAQSRVQSRARNADKSVARTSRARILLVNDDTATMNFDVDLWRNQGFSVDYAFDVPQAIRSIQDFPPDLIVSDLSHYSSGKLITERAAFEILEWASDTHLDLKLIITTSEVSPERRITALKLGALGICNTLSELNELVEKATGIKIELPEELAKVDDRNHTSFKNEVLNPLTRIFHQEVRKEPKIFISFSRKDSDFVRMLANDLKVNGVTVWDNLNEIPTGASWASPIKQAIETADYMLAVMSRHSIESDWVQREIYMGKSKEEQGISSRFIIPLIIDDEAVEHMPYFIHRKQYLDFRKNYKIALDSLLKLVKTQ
jgi:DNA-binding response OmpR family regulator